jgi:hypothetical protein
MRIEIIVVSHGWVVVGVVVDDGRESGEILLAYAHSIDRWGTTKGIAQLCHEGPRKETKLNPLVPYDAQLRINRAHGMLFLPCDSAKWLSALGAS